MAAAFTPTQSKTRAPSSCPRCGARGRKVAAVTLGSLLCAKAARRFDGSPGFRFCKTETCDVVYFDSLSATLFQTHDLGVPVFQKSTDPTRLVCYCFEHTVEAVREDASATGASAIADDVAAKCRRGLARCEQMNPQGSCCLRNMRQLARAAIAAADTTGEGETLCTQDIPACCTFRSQR